MEIAKNAQNQVSILGVRIDSIPKERLLTAIGNYLAKKRQFSVFTPNPEIVLQAQTNRNLRLAIDKCTFSVPDGVGLKIFGNRNLEIFHGRKLMLDLFKLANEKSLKVFFITSDEKDTKEKLLTRLKLEYPQVQAQAMVGPRLDLDARPVSEMEIKIQKDIVQTINSFKPDLLFVTFGAPKQELWIDANLAKLDCVGALGIGGALDYYAGTAKLPPSWMQDLELEWLWRLIQEPKRFKRIVNAIIVFPFYILFKR